MQGYATITINVFISKLFALFDHHKAEAISYVAVYVTIKILLLNLSTQNSRHE